MTETQETITIDDEALKVLQAKKHGFSTTLALTKLIDPGQYYVVQKGKLDDEIVLIIREATNESEVVHKKEIIKHESIF